MTEPPLRLIAFALVASLLLVTATPATVAASSHNESAASLHTTAADFNGATQLTNVSVVGSGTGSSVELDSQDTFGTTASRDPDDASFDNNYRSGIIINPNTDLSGVNATISSNPSGYSRAQLRYHSNGTVIDTVDVSGHANGDWVEFRADLNAGVDYRLVLGNEGATYTLGKDDNPSFPYSSSSVDITSSVYNNGSTTDTLNAFSFRRVTAVTASSAANGMYVSSTHNASDLTSAWTNLTLTNTTAHVSWLADTDGDGTFETTANSSTFASTGNHTLDVSGTSASAWRVNVTFEPTGDDSTAELEDEGLLFQARDPGASNLDPNGTTISGQSSVQLNVTVSDRDFGTAQGDNVTVEWTFDGSVVDTQTVASNGTYSSTVTGLQDGQYVWNVSLTDEYGGTNQSGDATVTLRNQPPQLSNPQPADGTTISDFSANLSVDLNDSDFGSPGDNVTVVFYDLSDDSEIHNVTVSANQTIETTWSGLDMGANEWNVTAADQFSNSNALGPFTVNTPSNLSIRDEETLEVLDNTTSNVTVTFYPEGDTGEIVERETDTGVISLEGLPGDQEFIVQASVDGYHGRRALIRDISQQQDIYLLNESSDAATISFELDDRTGEFGEGTRLLIDRPITENGSTTFQNVFTDEFGPGAISVALLNGQRYRIRLEALDGDIRAVGPYTPEGADTVIIQLDERSVNLDPPAHPVGFNWDAEYTVIDGSNNQIEVSFQDNQTLTSSLTVRIVNRSNTSHVLREESFSDVGNVTIVETVPTAHNDTQWIVEIEGTRDGEAFTASRQVGPGISTELGLQPEVRAAASFILTLVLGVAVGGGARADLGAIVASITAGICWIIGWMPGYATGALIGLALFVSVLYRHAVMGKGVPR